MSMKIWEGLAALDRIAEQVRSGTYVQPEYSFAQPVLEQPEATPEPLPMPVAEPKKSFDYDTLLEKLKTVKVI